MSNESMRKIMESISVSANESLEEDLAVRKATNKLHEWMDEGVLDPREVAAACLKYMSEDDVADMAHANEFDQIPGWNN